MKAHPFQIAYVPIGVGTFHLESAADLYARSVRVLQGITEGLQADGIPSALAVPDEMLLSIPLLTAYLDRLEPDLIILQNLTFANAAYAGEVLHRFSCPILLWTLPEPVIDGGRLRLNSLTGAFSAGNAICSFRDVKNGPAFSWLMGNPEEERSLRTLRTQIRAAALKYALGNLTIAAIGHTPQGFGFGRALDQELLSVFGVRLESVEARQLMEMAEACSEDDCAAERAQALQTMRGLERTPEENVAGFTRLLKAYRTYVRQNGIGALSSRCWPDFFTDYGTPVCGVLSVLNAEGIPASCEGDTYGALSMYMGQFLTKEAVFFGDPVSVSDEDNTITFWHCGMAACSLARPDTGAAVGVHPNRKIGPTMEFGVKASPEATIFRVGRAPDGSFRFFIAEGCIEDRPRQFLGTSAVVRVNGSAGRIVEQAVTDGWEPHFIVTFGSAEDELGALGRMLDIRVMRYS